MYRFIYYMNILVYIFLEVILKESKFCLLKIVLIVCV